MKTSKIVATIVVAMVVVAVPSVVEEWRDYQSRRFRSIEVGMLELDVREEFGGPDRVEDPEAGDMCGGKTIRHHLLRDQSRIIHLALH